MECHPARALAPDDLWFHVHAGIVTTVIAPGGAGTRAPYYDLTAIEGDTDASGKLGGGGHLL